MSLCVPTDREGQPIHSGDISGSSYHLPGDFGVLGCKGARFLCLLQKLGVIQSGPGQDYGFGLLTVPGDQRQVVVVPAR